jgi:hypothetical protein
MDVGLRPTSYVPCLIGAVQTFGAKREGFLVAFFDKAAIVEKHRTSETSAV